MNVDIQLLGLQNDTIQSYADRLQMRLVDQPIYATHLRKMEVIGKDTIELVFDAIPQEYMEPLRQIIGTHEDLEFFSFPLAEEPGQQGTGVRIKPKNLREVKDQALIDIGVETKEKKKDTNDAGVGTDTGLTVVDPEEVVERLLSEDEHVRQSVKSAGRCLLIIEVLARGFGKVISGQDLVSETFKDAATAWGQFKEKVAGYHYQIEDIQPELLKRPAGRQTVVVEGGMTGEKLGEVTFSWRPRDKGTEISARYRHFADGPASDTRSS